jgi:cytochrome c-type biogenesis protein CcmF
MSAAAATVLLGTLYPLLLDVVAGQKISVGPPYFNSTFVPLMVPMIAVMAIGPFLGWRRGDLAAIMGRLWIMFLAMTIVTLATWQLVTGNSILAALGLGLAAWLFIGTVVEYADRIKLFRAGLFDSLRRARRLPRAAYGMTVAHLGVAVLVAGITGSSAWQSEKILMMGVGDSVELADYGFVLAAVTEADGPNYSTVRASFIVRKDGVEITRLYPERRTYLVQQRPTTEAAIQTLGLDDIYAVIGEPDGDGRWIVRLYYRPLVPLLWAGMLIMALGAFVSLFDRRSRIGIPARRAAAAAIRPAVAPPVAPPAGA